MREGWVVWGKDWEEKKEGRGNCDWVEKLIN